MDLIEAWRAWALQCEGPPYELDMDKKALHALKEQRKVAPFTDLDTAIKDERLSKGGDTRLHLGLIPVPFMGNVREASIYVLMLNPGLSLGHYFEHKAPSFRDALIANLRQERLEGIKSFPIMDPQFAWHSGFNYWHQRLGRVIKLLADHKGMSFIQAREELASKLAVIQLVPYRSATFGHRELLEEPKYGGLHSVKLVKDFVQSKVADRVSNREAIVIIARQVKTWEKFLPAGLPQKRVVRYNSHEARGAWLGPRTKGGRAILKHLGIPTNG